MYDFLLTSSSDIFHWTLHDIIILDDQDSIETYAVSRVTIRYRILISFGGVRLTEI
jgi:hypothetical protein